MSSPDGSPAFASDASLRVSISRRGLKNSAPSRMRIRSLPHVARPPHTVWMGNLLRRRTFRTEVVRLHSKTSGLPKIRIVGIYWAKSTATLSAISSTVWLPASFIAYWLGALMPRMGVPRASAVNVTAGGRRTT